MFVYTAKVTKRKAAAGFLILGLAVCSALSLTAASDNVKYDGDAAMEAMSVNESESASKILQTEQERRNFLKDLGWEIEDTSSEPTEVIIPTDFDDIYEAYNVMQKENGFNLSKYKGKLASLYTYIIKNHPSNEAETYANLLIYKNKIIGGDICSKSADGFMHGICERTKAETDCAKPTADK